MSGFFYFFEGACDAGRFDAAGLGDRLSERRSITEIDATIGPNGMSGLVIHGHATGLPQPLTWERSACGGYWLGWHEPCPPGPDALQRLGVTLSGFYVRLGDGNDWLVPLVKPCRSLDPARPCGLPQAPEVITLEGQSTDDGRPIEWTHAPRYDGLVEQAETMLAAFLDADSAPPGPPCFDYLVALLACGYHVGADEVLALELFDTDTAAAAYLASFDGTERYRARYGEAAMAGVS